LHATADERRRVVEYPNELIRQGRDLDADRACERSAGHEKNGHFGVALPHGAQQLDRLLVTGLVGLPLRPVEEDAVNARIGYDRCQTVLVGKRFDDLDRPSVQFRDQAAHAAGGGARRPGEPLVDDENPLGERTASSTLHHGATFSERIRIARR
jgi:hypothetical protein